MWSEVMTTMLRFMVNDYGTPQTYTDNVLKSALLVNAQFVAQELNFSQTFTVDLVKLNLTPDPTGGMPPQFDSMGNQITPATPPDYNFINLTVLRTAVMITMNEYRTATNSAIMFREFHSQADMRGIAAAKKELWTELEKIYKQKQLHYQVGIRVSGQAILSPINIIAGGWRGPIYVYSDHDRFVI